MASINVDNNPTQHIGQITITPETDFAGEFCREVAELLGKDEMELPRLYSHVDPDVLEGLFTPPYPGGETFSGSISFEYDSFYVTLEVLEHREAGPGEEVTRVGVLVLPKEMP